MNDSNVQTQLPEADQASEAILAEQGLNSSIEQVSNTADVIAIDTREKVAGTSPEVQISTFVDRIGNADNKESAIQIMNEAVEAGLLVPNGNGKWKPVNKKVKAAQKIVDAYRVKWTKLGKKAAAISNELAPEVTETVPVEVEVAPEVTEAPSYTDRFKSATTKEQFMEITNEMFNAASNVDELKKSMNECKAAQIVVWQGKGFKPSNRWGSDEYKKMVWDTLINEYYTCLKAFKPSKADAKKVEAKAEKAKEVPAEKAVNPLEITMEDGKVFPNADKFERFITTRLRRAKTDEEKSELTAYQEAYAKSFNERINQIRKDVNRVRNQVMTAIKIRRHPDNKNGKPGVKDYMKTLIDQGLAVVKNDQLLNAEGFTMADPAIEAALNRIDDLNLVKDIENGRKIDGFVHRDKNAYYAYQIHTKPNSITKKTDVEVYNLISVYGKPEFTLGKYTVGINCSTNLALAVKEYERRVAKRDENRAKYDAARKAEAEKKKADEATA